MLNPRIVNIEQKYLVGKKLEMNFLHLKIIDLWKSFMPFKNSIPNQVSENLYSLTVYRPDHFINFKPSNLFEKWATVEVQSAENIPEEFELFILEPATYAIFDYKGYSHDSTIFQEIYMKWVPESGFSLDNKAHVEVLGKKYKNNDPNSEEEIWIPIKNKDK